MQGKLTSKNTVRALLESRGVRLKKRFGQNFLVDDNIAEKIVDCAEISLGDVVVEVGAGLGALSQKIAPLCKKLILVEIDRDMAQILGEVMGEFSNVTILNEDALKTDFASLAQNESLKIISNVPYYITTPLIERFLSLHGCVSKIILMVQKEVARRVCASPGGKDYSSFSVFCSFLARAEYLFEVPPTVFLPPPKVSSAVLSLSPVVRNVAKEKEEFFFKVVRASFSSRRKTLVNSLSMGLSLDKDKITRALLAMGLSPQVRAERLGWEDFLLLCENLQA